MLHHTLEQRLHQAVVARLPEVALGSIFVRPCPDPRFGDYQTNALMALAKERKLNPRQLATEIRAALQVDDLCESVEVAGAGFLNFRLRPQAVAEILRAALRNEHLFYRTSPQPRTVVVDFSSPNVAKPMHVGHIRSTVLGDCLARTLRLLGHNVITDNHLGDWGTQFGKLLVGWKDLLDKDALAQDPIAEMERLYKTVHALSENDPALLERAKSELVKLQNGDPENLGIWRQMIALSRAYFDAIYSRLGVKFDHTLGESFYNPHLKDIVQELLNRGIAQESEGAVVVSFGDQADLKDSVAMIQKSDGASNYTTTDLATLAYRMGTWHPNDIVYVTDGRQQLHFRQLFAVFRRWHPDAQVRLAHVWFGTILGPDGRPFKTKSGDTIKLADILDEAEERVMREVAERNPDLDEPRRQEIARIVGLGAVKYSDLLPNRQSDYVFDWDKMLALNGNTAPYLLYAYTRTCGVFRKLSTEGESVQGWREGALDSLALGAAEELRLAKHMLNFGIVLEAVAEEYRPNYLCNYLFELAGHFTSFYENCPVLKAAEPERSSRLALCELAGRVLKQGLEVLGIETTERM